MAASVASFGPTALDTTCSETPAPGDQEDVRWVLPSEVDCLGRDVPTTSFGARFRERLSPRALLGLADNIRVWLL